MTILELIKILKNDTHIIVRFEDTGEEILNFWKDDYFENNLWSQGNKIIETTCVECFDFEDCVMIIFVDNLSI